MDQQSKNALSACLMGTESFKEFLFWAAKKAATQLRAVDPLAADSFEEMNEICLPVCTEAIRLAPYESPIETLFFNSLMIATLRCFRVPCVFIGQAAPFPVEEHPGDATCIAVIELQRRIGRFRVDGLVYCPAHQDRFVIECDGFQHHGSQDSFVKDRKRDRWLQSEGFKVHRYSGSEIKVDYGQIAGNLVAEVFHL